MLSILYGTKLCHVYPIMKFINNAINFSGAKVIVTPKAGKGTGMVEKAKELSEKHGWFLCHQFETEANWKFHYDTTVSTLIYCVALAYTSVKRCILKIFYIIVYNIGS